MNDHDKQEKSAMAMDAKSTLSKLDAELSQAEANVGVAVGDDLWAECKRQGLIRMKPFSVLGTTFLMQNLPTYKDHFISIDVDFGPLDFQVGGRGRINA